MNMKKLCVGVVLGLALLFAQKASAMPCGLCSYGYHPCGWTCENCVPSRGGPGLWIEDGYCWGEIVETTCGEAQQWGCGESLSALSSCQAPFLGQGVNPASVPAAAPSL